MAAPGPKGPVTVLWDYENCPAPAQDRAYIDGTTLVSRLCAEFLKFGPIVEVKTFGNVSTIRAAMREELQTSAVTVIDAQAVDKRKDLVDKMIFTHMFCFALDHPPPATIILISGDVDYALPLAMLKLRKYHIVLVKPSGRNVNAKLLGVAHEIYDWEDLLFPERLASDLAVVDPTPTPSPAVLRPPVTSSSSKDIPDRPAMTGDRRSKGSHSIQPTRAASATEPGDVAPTAASLLVKTVKEFKETKGKQHDHKDAGKHEKETERHATEAGDAPVTPIKTPSLGVPSMSTTPASGASSPQPPQLIPRPMLAQHTHTSLESDPGDDSSDEASSLSDIAARIHLRDFVYVLVELHKLGDREPLITKVGSRLHERYPKLFKKGTQIREISLFAQFATALRKAAGTATRLAKEAEHAKLVQISGNPPQRRLKYAAANLYDYIETND